MEEKLTNDLQISGLAIQNTLTTNEIVTDDIQIDNISMKTKLQDISAIYNKKIIVQIGEDKYMFFGRELED